MPFSQQRQDALRVGDEGLRTEHLRIFWHRVFVAQEKYWQSLVVFVQRIDHDGSWARVRQTFDV